jgi:hypothetical protein
LCCPISCCMLPTTLGRHCVIYIFGTYVMYCQIHTHLCIRHGVQTISYKSRKCEDGHRYVEMISLVKPLYLIGGGSWPLGFPRLPRSDGFPYVDPDKPLIPSIRPHKRYFNYPKYVKVRIFNVTIRANGEINRYCKSIQFHTWKCNLWLE